MNRRSTGHLLRVATAFSALVFLAISVTSAQVAASAGGSCASGLGVDTPVLLVHGFHEPPTGPNGVWTSGSPSMETAIAKIPGVKVVAPFNYYTTADNAMDWVTDPAIGAALAADITCLADTSAADGGPGKVVIVAHSMGGLAVRCAVDPGCAGQGKAANPHIIALVVTLGTPNLGSLLANVGQSLTGARKNQKIHVKEPGIFESSFVESSDRLLCAQISKCKDLASLLTAASSPAARAMQIGSQELQPQALAPLPTEIPLDAIAGKITLTTTLFGIPGLFSITGDVGDVGDAVVSVQSAQDPQGPAHPGPGSWQPTLDCGSVPVDQLPEWGIQQAFNQSLVKCWHLTETTDPAWQADVVTAIQPVAAALSLTSCTSSALTKGLLAANPQLNNYTWTLRASACQGNWAVAQVYAPAVGSGTAFLMRTSSGWKSAPLGEGSCSARPGAFASPVPAPSLAASLLRRAGICGATALPNFYYADAVLPEVLYSSPTYPKELAIDNHEGIAIQSLDTWNPETMIMTGILDHDECQPDCAAGPIAKFPVRVVATDPQTCALLRNQSASTLPAQAYVYTRITVTPLSGNPPPYLVGDSVFKACS